MHRFAPVALATLLAATAPAHLQAHSQAAAPHAAPTTFTDPANLRGERVRPRDGRELPIDSPEATGGHGLQQLLRKLNTRASLMLIVAHPDDEDGGMLTFYSRGLGARVAVLTLTRGEGGQNAMTGDFEDALGLIRTQELLAADRYMGVDQFFGTEVDFGFSKTKEEAFRKWPHDRVLYDAVRAVRLYRPLVIAAVFSGAVTDGHGQHQVSGQIAQEVFKAAGDPNVFPELTREGILPWQPLKVFARVPFSRVTAQGLYDYATGQVVPAQFTNYVTGQTFSTEPTADLTIHEGATDPLLTYAAANPADLHTQPTDLNAPLSYVQFARIGLGLQRSQIGPNIRVPPAGRVDVGYHLYGSRVCAPSLPNPTPNLCSTRAANVPPVTLSENPHSRSAKFKPVILSDRSEAKGVEEPRESSSNHDSSPVSNPELARDATFFDGIDTSISGIATLSRQPPSALTTGLTKLSASLSGAESSYDPKNPAAVAPALGEALDQVERLLADSAASESIRHELLIKRAQLNQALALALGLSFDATTSTADLITLTPVKVTSRIEEASSIELKVKDVTLQSPTGGKSEPTEEKRANRALSSTHPDQRTLSLSAAENFAPTQPYFFRDTIEQSVYKLRSEALRNAPATPPALIALAHIDYRGTDIELARVVHSGAQSTSFIPPVSLSLASHAQAVPLTQHSLSLTAHVDSPDGPVSGRLMLSSAGHWTGKPDSLPLHTGDSSFSIVSTNTPQPDTITAIARTTSGSHVREGFRSVGYGSLPRTNFYTPATLRVVPIDLKLPPENKRRIAYLPGTGDDVPAALASIGLTPTILTVADLTPDKLARFDTVVLGVRTYNAHPDLHGAPTQALLDFARNGGNVVVQYQTEYMANEFTAADAPYPLTLQAERVMDETAPVHLLTSGTPSPQPGVAAGLSPRDRAMAEKGALAPGLSLLTTPNKITPADFNGWIEERGHGFLDTWDSHYTALTETHDPGAPSEHISDQAPQRGGLITTHLGKGRWTYCAFAIYRQLPEAVPGAFRLFVNLLNP